MLQRGVALLVILAFSTSFFPIRSFAEGPGGHPSGSLEKSASATVTPRNGGTISLGGVRLEIPAGAVERPLKITIRTLGATADLDEGMSNATAGAWGYRFEPHGTVFRKPIRLVMPFDQGIGESETALSNLSTYFYDEKDKAWEALERETIDRAGFEVISLTRHFTDMINATLKLPEGPSPVQFDANSIKNLEAADPAAGVAKLDGPGASPFGYASFRVPLRLPQGRGGATPELALSYSSEGGNGLLGRGFDLAMPAIVIDTRFGLPDYNGRDRYSLEGEDLLYKSRDGSADAFVARTEKAFRKIRHYRDASDDYWVVTDRDGTFREYGRDGGWNGKGRAASDRSQTNTWYLTRSQDPFGNTAVYEYWYDVSNRFVYPQRILYSGSAVDGSVTPAFEVSFTLDGGDRPDRRIDERGKFLSKLAYRLSRIDVSYRSQKVRSYGFSYVENEFGQSQLAKYSEYNAGSADPFYSYDFQYYGLEPHPGGGYEAFGPEEQWGATNDEHCRTLNRTINTSVGGSLYLGIKVELPTIKWDGWWPSLGWDEVINMGIRGAATFGAGAMSSTMIDANGDGLPDMAWKEGDNLFAYLNTGKGFDVSRPFRVGGLGGKMEEDASTNLEIGASANIWGTGGGITYQTGWTNGLSTFSDVNGDGYLDYLRAKSGGYWLNVAGGAAGDRGFEYQGLNWGRKAPSPNYSDPQEENYRKSYYVQEPVRRWKSFRSGRVEVTQTGKLVDGDRASEDGVSLRTYAGLSPTVEQIIQLSPSVTSGDALPKSYDMQTGGALYFRMDTQGVEQGDTVDWGVKIHYRDLAYFERMNEGASFDPPLEVQGSLPYEDSRFAPIYDTQLRNVGNNVWITFYVRKNGWEAMGESVLGQVYEALADHGAFTPSRIDLASYLAVKGSSAWNDPLPFDLEKGQDENRLSNYFSMGYSYEPETRSFRRNTGIDPRMVARVNEAAGLVVAAMSPAARRASALYRWIDGSYRIQRATGNNRSITSTAPGESLPAEIAEGFLPGNVDPTRGYLLDTLYESEGSSTVRERLWLQKDGTSWRLFPG